MDYPSGYLEGLELFNSGSFWHAHEAWEAVWLVQQEQNRQFVQGLIQTAAALVHWQRGNKRGLVLNWTKARAKLAPLQSPFWGLNLHGLVATMDAMVRGEHSTPPQLHLNI